MDKKSKSYICRECEKMVNPEFRYWEMSEWRENHDGTSYLHEWSGYTPYCRECKRIVKSKREWYIQDWEEENFGTFFFWFIISVLLSISGIFFSDFGYEIFSSIVCSSGLLIFIFSIIFMEIGKRKYIREREEE